MILRVVVFASDIWLTGDMISVALTEDKLHLDTHEEIPGTFPQQKDSAKLKWQQVSHSS